MKKRVWCRLALAVVVWAGANGEVNAATAAKVRTEQLGSGWGGELAPSRTAENSGKTGGSGWGAQEPTPAAPATPAPAPMKTAKPKPATTARPTPVATVARAAAAPVVSASPAVTVARTAAAPVASAASAATVAAPVAPQPAVADRSPVVSMTVATPAQLLAAAAAAPPPPAMAAKAVAAAAPAPAPAAPAPAPAAAAGQFPGRVVEKPSRPRPDDTPTIKMGATLFSDYTYTETPISTDADGNPFNSAVFNVGRAYLNITGNISHVVSFRFTPDISRETGSGSSLNGSLSYRIKYAFAQVGLDDWLGKGTWARFGIQQTPILDFEETIYRYRFQGTVFSEREGYLTSSDAGASFHANLPKNFGDVHVGYYNGDGYSKIENNNQKAMQVRGTVRPLAAAAPVLRGLRVTLFYDNDRYVAFGTKDRMQGTVTFEHKHLNAGVDYLTTADRTSVRATEVDGSGYSFWMTPRLAHGVEGLFRYDNMTTNRVTDTRHKRTIAGAAYWFPHQGSVSSAFLFDIERLQSLNFAPVQPDQKRVAVHALIAF